MAENNGPAGPSPLRRPRHQDGQDRLKPYEKPPVVVLGQRNNINDRVALRVIQGPLVPSLLPKDKKDVVGKKPVGVIGEHRNKGHQNYKKIILSSTQSSSSSSLSLSSSSGGGGGSFVPVESSCVIIHGTATIAAAPAVIEGQGHTDVADKIVEGGVSPIDLVVRPPPQQQQQLPVEKEVEEQAVSWNPFSSIVNVTEGLFNLTQNLQQQSQPQPQQRGLNTSFTEKFVSRLEIKSAAKEDDEGNVNDDEAEADKENKENEEILGQIIRQPSSSFKGILVERMDPLFDCPEYIHDILKYWRRTERRFRIKPDYMTRHSQISHKMRSILVDWLNEVVMEYDLNDETLHLAVNFVDRFLQRMFVERTKLQLVGAAALYIASKFEEKCPPEIGDFVFVTDEAYTKEEILEMERCMLIALEFDLMMPTSYNFIRSFCSLLKIGDPIRSLASYLVELALMDGETFLKYVPSVLAGAALALARFTYSRIDYWDDELEQHCGHRKGTITACVKELHPIFYAAPFREQNSMYDKYKGSKYSNVSKTAQVPLEGPWNAIVVAKKAVSSLFSLKLKRGKSKKTKSSMKSRSSCCSTTSSRNRKR